MAINKVEYFDRTLIDLTADTVTEETLLRGFTAHKADGTIITGSMLDGFPDIFSVDDPIEDSDGDYILDGDDDPIYAIIIYQKM